MKIDLAKSEIINFVGIGGIGMSGLALIMHGMGFQIQGSDISSNKNIERLKQNKTISIVSDAGTPVISDPGYKLIQECIKNNIKYTLIPGPSSVISALIMSGLPTDKFSFYGFVPRKKSEQENFFESVVNDEKTIVFFESSKRLDKWLIKE